MGARVYERRSRLSGIDDDRALIGVDGVWLARLILPTRVGFFGIDPTPSSLVCCTAACDLDATGTIDQEFVTIRNGNGFLK